jgi:D-lyxose ketol-isomerase
LKRSEINLLVAEASQAFADAGWHLGPLPRWDVTDFGLGEWQRYGLVLVNLAEEPEYCEKLMYARRGMTTPWHYHLKKKEDIICRSGCLVVYVKPSVGGGPDLVKVNREPIEVTGPQTYILTPGHRITLTPGVIHDRGGQHGKRRSSRQRLP